MKTQQRSEFSAGWKVLLAGFLGTMCGAAPLPFNVLGFLFKPLAEYGWTKAEVALGVTIYGVVGASLAPVFGTMADKYGVRRVGIFSLIAFIPAFAALALIPNSLPVYYLIWLGIGLVGIGSTPVSWSRAVSMWFVKNRGLALGMMLIGTSIAGMLIPKISVWAMGHWSWRAIFPTLALMPLLIALPAVITWFREPRPEETPAALVNADGKIAGMTLGDAMKTRQFWLIWLSIFCVSLAYGGAHGHMIPIVMDHGMTVEAAAGVMGVVALGLLAGRIIVGLLLDRVWAPLVAFPVMCLPAVACLMLMGTASLGSTVFVAAFMLGFAGGAESDLIAFLAARYFGMANFGRIYGMLYLPFGVCSSISPVIYGLVRDGTGSYNSALTAAAIVFVAGGALLLLLGRYPTGFSKAAQ